MSQSQHGCAMTDTPNTDLLLRQRTFSIDETREQMQQGRPVQREAIIAGEVDMGSLFYGEDTAAPAGPGGKSVTAGAPQHQTQKKSSSAGGSWAGVLMKGGEGPPPPPPAHPTPSPQKRPEAPKASTGGSAAGGASGSSSDKKGSTSASAEGGKKRDNRREVSGREGCRDTVRGVCRC